MFLFIRFGLDDPKFQQLDSEEGHDYESDPKPVGDFHIPELAGVSDRFLFRFTEGPAARVASQLTRNELLFADLISDVGKKHRNK
jgi:hypothetical protein